jgi:MFS family permease
VELIGRLIDISCKTIFGLLLTILISACVTGFSFGIGLTYPLCGFLIAHFGWRVVFYVTGTVGILWCLMWSLLAFDTPAQHPRISASERQYIESNVGNTVVGEKVSNTAIPFTENSSSNNKSNTNNNYYYYYSIQFSSLFY